MSNATCLLGNVHSTLIFHNTLLRNFLHVIRSTLLIMDNLTSVCGLDNLTGYEKHEKDIFENIFLNRVFVLLKMLLLRNGNGEMWKFCNL